MAQSGLEREGFPLRRVGIFGWGLVAPRSPNIAAFAENLACNGSWLEPFNGFGPDNFLVGVPQFSFADYRGWIAERFPPLALPLSWRRRWTCRCTTPSAPSSRPWGRTPGWRRSWRRSAPPPTSTWGPGIGCVQTVANNTRALDRAQRRWDRFWAERNPAFQDHLAAGGEVPEGAPPDPATVADPEDRYDAEAAWWHYWAASSPDLQDYLRELAADRGAQRPGATSRRAR